MAKKSKIKINIKIEGDIEINDELSLEELNDYLEKRTNPSVVQFLSEFLDLEKDMITIESKYE